MTDNPETATLPAATVSALIELERLILEHKVHLLRGGYDALTYQTDTLLAVCRRAMGVVPRTNGGH